MLALVDISTCFKKMLHNSCMATWTTPGAVHGKFTADLTVLVWLGLISFL